MATIHDVARAAGVSIATVSRVFNGSLRVSEAARRRVQAASAQLDYAPNVTARSLTTSRSHALGVLLPDLYGEFFSEVIRGLDQAARDAKLQILLSSSHADAHALLSAARSMRGRVDGLIAMAPDRDSTDAMRRVATTVPVVLLNPGLRVEGCSSVSIANFEGARTLMRHLLGLGHRRIAMIKGPPGNVDAEERLRGYRQALRAAHLDHDLDLEIAGDFTEASGFRAAAALLRAKPRPTAVFAANDNMAVGLLSALREARVEVPAALAVTGFDDIAIAQYVAPPLTTVRVDAQELGGRAIRLWLEAARSPGGAMRRHEVLPARLVVRESCGAAAATRPAPARAGNGSIPSRSRHPLAPHPAPRRPRP